MSFATLTSNATAHVRAIRLCLEQNLRMPALALIYCGIDFMAALGRPAAKKRADRCDFTVWAERYLGCRERLGVSGLELYAARCGILHTYGAASDLSHSGKARQIVYAWGTASPDRPNALLELLGPRLEPRSRGVMIKIETLAHAFAEGIERFLEDIDGDGAMRELVEQRARGMFLDRPTFP